MGKNDVEVFIKKIGLRVRELRIKQNMTQLDLAVKANMDESQIQRLETARSSPTFKTLYKVIKGLDTEFSIFFTFTESIDNTKNNI